MKNFYALIVTLFLVNGAMSQTSKPCSSCLPQGIVFSTQAQIDSFQFNYPGCTEIMGDVYISGDDITNLNGLDVLTSIWGSLNIGSMWVYSNPLLSNLTGLDNITYIGGILAILKNTALSSLAGMEGLVLIENVLWIADNPFLSNLTGLNNLAVIGGMQIINNNELINLTGLEGLMSVNSSAYIANNQSMTSLAGLEAVISIGDRLHIEGNEALTSLAGIDNLESTSITDLYIINNVNLSVCEAEWLCEFLTTPNGSINIYGNAVGCEDPPAIANVCGITLPCLPYGNFYFLNQAQIDSFQSDYPNCQSLGGDVKISGVDITDLSGFNELNCIGNNLEVTGNNNLLNLTGLEGLNYIGGRLKIESNDILNTLTGLENLAIIAGGGISIQNNDSLTNLTGLDNIVSIEGSLIISSNQTLHSLSGLDNVDAGSILNLSIYNNNTLSTCEVQSICDYLASPTGQILIFGNATGCNSQQEVEDACTQLGIESLNQETFLTIYPNPSSTTIIVDTPTQGVLSIHNTNGHQLLQQEITETVTSINISGWKSGVYFVKIVGGKRVQVGKFIKQ